MKIIGFDQSTKVTGYAIYEDGELVKHSAIRATSNNVYDRMRTMYNNVRRLIRREKPDFVILEATQFQNNYKVYSSLSQLQGLFFAVLFESGIEFDVVEASAWRSENGVRGRNRQEQKQAAIDLVKELGIKENVEDVCEAILIARYGALKMKENL